MKRYDRNTNLKPLSRELRTYGTKGEAVLWKKVLKARLMNGYQFNRQFIIENYIVDFICRKLNLIIEIDGSSHITKGSADYDRQLRLEELGFTVLRFPEFEVLGALEDVHNKIYYAIEAIEEKLKLNKS
ncbi:MAG: endonuclease domain-containing protein [Bacteroidales bacterium]|nr:endonuclease domain-containing protein [Bacteroidales bacterium]